MLHIHIFPELLSVLWSYGDFMKYELLQQLVYMSHNQICIYSSPRFFLTLLETFSEKGRNA